MIRRFIACLWLVLLLVLAHGLPSGFAQEPVCTLSDRIKSANANIAIGNCPAGTGHDIITLAEDITLTEPLPAITGTITIEGGGHTISGDNKRRIFTVRGGRLAINNLTLTKGKVFKQGDLIEGGGAIMIVGYSTLSVNNSVFSFNSALDGGAIGLGYEYTVPNITINNSSFISNSAFPGPGGAIDTTRMRGGEINIMNSSFIRNSSGHRGGAVSVLSNVVVNISNSTFQHNYAPYGGAVSGELGETTLTHVTMVNNFARTSGGAIWTPPVRESYLGRAKVNLFNSIITGDNSYYDDDCQGRLNESKGNLTDGSCSPTVYGEPLLAEPTGSPVYFPLQDGSPALDAADPKYCLPTDQLGNPRPHGAGCDIGAIESTTAIPVPTPVPAFCPLDDQIIAANTDTGVGPCPAGNGADVIYMVRDFTLADRLPPITSEITILGNGYTISGEDKFGLFEVDGGKLTIKDLTLTKGNAAEGGAIRLRNGGQAAVENVTFVENSATAGGAIAAEHYKVRLDVSKSRFHRNRADDNGGAIYINGGVVNISGSAFQDNSAAYFGGALYTADGRVSVSNSTFSGSSAAEGGGIYANGAETTVTHVTIVGNRASQARAGGIYKESGLLYLRNSVVAGSILGDDCYGLLDQSRGNFSQDGTCGTQPGGDPLLDELTGTPAHHPLQHNSPAHGAADPSFCLPTDQLGQPRRAAWCDIGAVETERDSSAPPARAAIPPDCSLGDQIVAANTDAPAGACPAGDGADTISLTKDLWLSGPLPPITSDITIRGNGHTLDGAGRYRIFDIGGEGFPHVAY